MRILVVDDEADIRIMLRTLLEAHGWSVDEAVDGLDAVERADAGSYEAFLVDHMMPRMSGLEVARHLRADAFTGPIIFYSAFISDELRADLMREVDKELYIISKTDFPRLLETVMSLSAA